VPPIWHLRLGDYRVFCDVDEVEGWVFVRAVGPRPTHQTTEGRPVKTISARDLQKRITEALDSAQRDRVVITRGGQPAAVLVGVEGMDWESVVLETSPELWRLIEERRAEPTLSAEELVRELARE